MGAELRSELQSVECPEDFGPGGQIMRNVSRIAAPGSIQIPRGLAELDHAKGLGGSAKEKPSRVWGMSGVGAQLRSEQCLRILALDARF